jgi:hypothetical protein
MSKDPSNITGTKHRFLFLSIINVFHCIVEDDGCPSMITNYSFGLSCCARCVQVVQVVVGWDDQGTCGFASFLHRLERKFVGGVGVGGQQWALEDYSLQVRTVAVFHCLVHDLQIVNGLVRLLTCICTDQ